MLRALISYSSVYRARTKVHTHVTPQGGMCCGIWFEDDVRHLSAVTGEGSPSDALTAHLGGLYLMKEH